MSDYNHTQTPLTDEQYEAMKVEWKRCGYIWGHLPEVAATLNVRNDEIRDLRARIGELVRQRDAALEAARKAEAENMCDACAGGHPISGIPCMCGGSGKMSDAARWLRVQLVKSEAERDEAVGLLSAMTPYLDAHYYSSGSATVYGHVVDIRAFLARLRARPAEKTSEPPCPHGRPSPQACSECTDTAVLANTDARVAYFKNKAERMALWPMPTHPICIASEPAVTGAGQQRPQNTLAAGASEEAAFSPPDEARKAAVSVVVRDGRVLCVWNRRYKGWSLPGGMVEEGETPEAAQRRELEEETGMGTASAKLVHEGPHGLPHKPGRASMVCVYLVEATGEPVTELEQGCMVEWQTVETFLKDSPFRGFYAGILPGIVASARRDPGSSAYDPPDEARALAPGRPSEEDERLPRQGRAALMLTEAEFNGGVER